MNKGLDILNVDLLGAGHHPAAVPAAAAAVTKEEDSKIWKIPL